MDTHVTCDLCGAAFTQSTFSRHRKSCSGASGKRSHSSVRVSAVLWSLSIMIFLDVFV
jgi:hypothetical protein